MIVTADPLGDFNATSQILRYSALAREVTVPRIPSVTSTILSAATGGNAGSNKSQLTSGRTSPSSAIADEAVVEMAFSEIARLTEEVEILGVRLADEEQRRREAEEAWQRVEEKAEELERDVREECWEEMERKIEEERRRWINAWGEEVVLQLNLDLQKKSNANPPTRLIATTSTSTANSKFFPKAFKVRKLPTPEPPTHSPNSTKVSNPETRIQSTKTMPLLQRRRTAVKKIWKPKTIDCGAKSTSWSANYRSNRPPDRTTRRSRRRCSENPRSWTTAGRRCSS